MRPKWRVLCETTAQPCAERDARDQHINLADELAALFQVRPDVGSLDSSGVRERQYPMLLAERLKVGSLPGGLGRLQASRDLIVAQPRHSISSVSGQRMHSKELAEGGERFCRFCQ
jgi:hypothetical protein